MPLDQEVALVTVDDVALDAGAPEADFVKIERMINAASRRIEAFCDRPFKARDVNLRFNGGGDALLDLGGPVQAVKAVTIMAPPSGGTNVDVPATDYVLDPIWGTLFYDAGWPRGVQNVQVICRLGIDPVPADVKEACQRLVTHWYKLAAGGGDLRSERIGDYSYERFAPVEGETDADIPQDVQAMLIPHKRWSI